MCISEARAVIGEVQGGCPQAERECSWSVAGAGAPLSGSVAVRGCCFTALPLKRGVLYLNVLLCAATCMGRGCRLYGLPVRARGHRGCHGAGQAAGPGRRPQASGN